MNVKIEIEAYREEHLPEMIRIWNEVVEEGIAFPQEELLDARTGKEFFEQQTYNAAAVNADTGEVCGLYILHPNNAVGSISVKLWFPTVSSRGGGSGLRSCSSMRWSRQMSTQDISMNGLVLSSSERFRKGFG